MLINFISGKSIIIATLLASGGFGAVAPTHMKPSELGHAATATTLRAKVSNKNRFKSVTTEPSITDNKSASLSTSGSTQLSNSTPVDNNLHGLCVAYRGDLMTSGVPANVQARIASSPAFLSLKELASSKGETIAVLCSTQGGVPITALPAATANLEAQSGSTTVQGTRSGSLSIGNRP